MLRNILSLCVFLFCLSTHAVNAEVRGKVDMGPTYLSIDLLKSGKTQNTVQMYGLKGDATVLVYEGNAIKPSFLVGTGKHAGLVSGNLAYGYYLPLTPKFKILPNVGYSWGYLHARTDIDLGVIVLKDLKERYRSESKFIGMDFSYTLNCKWSLIGAYQYAWCKSDVKIENNKSVSHSCGSNYSLGVDYTYNDNLSFNFGVGYNVALSKEKHGIRAKGVKLGASYYF